MTSDPLPSQILSCDWGTTSFRLRLVDTGRGAAIAAIGTADGMKELDRLAPSKAEAPARFKFFSDFMADQIERLARETTCAWTDPVTLVISGMASSSIGWRELAYASVPFSLDGSGAHFERFSSPCSSKRDLDVWLISGLATDHEMMRGEETELIGIAQLHPEWRDRFAPDSAVILPGTHSKWISIRNGAAASLRTFMTGELFEVLSEHSILRASVEREHTARFDERSFREGVQTAARDGLAGSLFQVRTRAVLRSTGGASNASFLSGLLIGAEWAHAAPDHQPLLLAAHDPLARSYRIAADELGLGDRVSQVRPEAMRNAVVLGHLQLLKTFWTRLSE